MAVDVEPPRTAAFLGKSPASRQVKGSLGRERAQLQQESCPLHQVPDLTLLHFGGEVSGPTIALLR